MTLPPQDGELTLEKLAELRSRLESREMIEYPEWREKVIAKLVQEVERLKAKNAKVIAGLRELANADNYYPASQGIFNLHHDSGVCELLSAWDAAERLLRVIESDEEKSE